MPPMIDTRMHFEAYFAYDLQVEMQSVFCRPPGFEWDFGEW